MFIFAVFTKFLKERMQDTRIEKKKVGKSVSQKGAKFAHQLEKFRTSAKFSL